MTSSFFSSYCHFQHSYLPEELKLCLSSFLAKSQRYTIFKLVHKASWSLKCKLLESSGETWWKSPLIFFFNSNCWRAGGLFLFWLSYKLKKTHYFYFSCLRSSFCTILETVQNKYCKMAHFCLHLFLSTNIDHLNHL